MSMIDSLLETHAPEAVELRHRLHRIPELGYEEHKTAAVIRARLKELGIAFVAGGPRIETATVAWLGDAAKPCVALRADIDALPITERTGLAYASEHEGRMHACGHDGHSAVLLGAAAVLKQIDHQLPVCVKLIFQPAEEGGGGADRLVEAGVLDGRIGPKARAIFGLHGWPGMKVGTVATRPGTLLASMDNFRAAFVGRGCHGGYPHLGRDPIVAAADAVLSLQRIVSREVDPTESAVVTVGQFHAGTAVNIIPERAELAGTVRALDDAVREKLAGAVRRRLEASAAGGGCALEYRWEDGYPPTVNDPGMADYVAAVARAALGEDRYVPVGRPSMGAEDFAYYLRQAPGCFFLLGVEPADVDGYPALHTDRYDFADGAVAVGMRMFVELALRFADAGPVTR